MVEAESEWGVGVGVRVGDGGVAMGLPWQGMVMLGTTDSAYEGDPAACSVSTSDSQQVLSEASLALPSELLRAEAVRFSFAGLRLLPLGAEITANTHREHLVQTGPFGMISIAGGKLTTHRRIALAALHRLPDPRL